MERMISMLMRQVMRRLVSRGVDKGIDAASRRTGAKDAPATPRQSAAAKAQSDKMKSAARMIRRFGRF